VITTIIILSLLVIFLGYSTLNVLRKLELYEESIEESDQYVLEIKEQLDKAIQDMRKIDSKGIFEEDDEVGQTFKQILKIIEGLEK
jgi:phosphate uptake regulator|tara:strand:+ start:322 stop:579 length:258 start_codon:yes stop_codon:yes gene_type:complete